MNRLLLSSLLLAASLIAQGPRVVATGLQGPQKVILTPRGNLLVSETSLQPNSGRISFLTRAGVRRSLFENLPSGTEVVGGGSGPTALALHDPRHLYIAIGAGDAERRNDRGQSIHNPAGVSSPIFSSILEVRFSNEIDALTSTFRLTPELQQTLADGWDVEVSDGAGSTARISLLVDFPNSQRDGAGYRFSNPWGLALSADGRTLWATDGSTNALLRVDTATGRPRKVVDFPPQPNPQAPVGPPVSEAVPTSLRLYGDQILVSLLNGVPFTPGRASVMIVDPERRVFAPFIGAITSAVDVIWRERAGARSQFWVLEFSTNQFANPAPPGRLLRYDSPDPTVVAADLRAPVSLALDEANGVLFVLELSGRLLEFPLGN